MLDDFNITTTIENRHGTFIIEGRLDATNAPKLEIETGNKILDLDSVTFDLAKCNYVSSFGLRTLLSVQKHLGLQEKVNVINVSEDVYMIFEVTGFTNFMNVKKKQLT